MKLTTLLLFLALALTPAREINPADTVCLSAEEKKLYDLMMAYRKSRGLDPIPLSAKLTKVAQVHAKDLAENHDPGQERCNLHSWSKKGAWTACCYTADHKEASCMWNKPREIAGYESNGYEISYYFSAGADAESGLDGWKKSTGHHQMIINDGIWKKIKWNAIGMGFYKEYGVVWFGDKKDQTLPEVCK
ncbi:MAG TPA: CAP domain-containing protein [Cyclobacteriaceae bacterium]|nr:CAP domain-containing protein [Cyclobacteriaceae bacterium]